MKGWLGHCEIAHAVADQPEGPYKYVSTVLSPRPGYFDGNTCHNPSIYKIDGRYWLFTWEQPMVNLERNVSDTL